MDPNNYKRHTPEEWQKILQNVLAILHKDHTDKDALDAVRESVEALNAYDQPAIEAGHHLSPDSQHPGQTTGWGDPLEAVKGVAEGGLDALLYPFHAANKVYREGPAALIDELAEGIKGIPDTFKGGDPRKIGQFTGNVAGGIATGKFLGKVGKGAGRAVSALAERPGLKNTLLKEQIAGTRELRSTRGDQSPLNTALLEGKKALMENKVDQIPAENEMFGKRSSLASQQLERGDPTLENINLRNELLRRSLEQDDTPPDPMDILSPKGPNPSTGPSILDFNKKSPNTPIQNYDPKSPENIDPYGLDQPNNSWRPTPNPDNPPDLKLVKDPVDILADELKPKSPKPPKK